MISWTQKVITNHLEWKEYFIWSECEVWRVPDTRSHFHICIWNWTYIYKKYLITILISSDLFINLIIKEPLKRSDRNSLYSVMAWSISLAVGNNSTLNEEMMKALPGGGIVWYECDIMCIGRKKDKQNIIVTVSQLFSGESFTFYSLLRFMYSHSHSLFRTLTNKHLR